MKEKCWTVYLYNTATMLLFHSYDLAFQRAKQEILKEFPGEWDEWSKPEDYNENCHTWEELAEYFLVQFGGADDIVSLDEREFED